MTDPKTLEEFGSIIFQLLENHSSRIYVLERRIKELEEKGNKTNESNIIETKNGVTINNGKFTGRLYKPKGNK